MDATARPPALPGADPRELMRRPGVVTFLAVLHVLGGTFALLLALALMIPAATKPLALAFGVACGGVALLHLATAFGLWRLRPYGRTLLFVLACVGLLAFPVGTIVSILILVYLTRPGARILFSGLDPKRLTGDELAALARLRKSGLGIAVGVTTGVLGLFFMIGVGAAIAVPNFVHAVQRAKQKRVIVELKAIGDRLDAYARAHGSYPDARTAADLARVLGRGAAVRTKDPWGNPYACMTFRTSEAAMGPDAYVLASAGLGGAWEKTGGDGYEPGAITDLESDIVYSNGEFIRAPAGAGSAPTRRP